MYFSTSFALGLYAYLRQAALSLDRAPTSFREAMRSYYDSHGLPPPARVAAHIDAPAQPPASMVANLLQRLFRNAVSLNETELREIRTALRGLETVLESQVVESNYERVRIRLALSHAETLVDRKLGRYAGRIQMIEHLNENPCLDLKPLGELVGANWPD
jgi:hypothetical protein